MNEILELMRKLEKKLSARINLSIEIEDGQSWVLVGSIKNWSGEKSLLYSGAFNESEIIEKLKQLLEEECER